MIQNGWGNYYHSTFTYTDTNGESITKKSYNGIIIPTGSTEYTKANNIYDMAGNVTDLTLESVSDYGRMGRGTYYRVSGGDISAAARGYRYPHSSGDGSRALLCIQL